MTQIPRLQTIKTSRELQLEALLTKLIKLRDDGHLQRIDWILNQEARDLLELSCTTCAKGEPCEDCGTEDDAETRYVDSLDAAELEAMPDIYGERS
jgi:hypothetical protein